MIKKKVMIVDDDKEFLEEINETLILSGYDSVCFFDGETALKMIGQVKPDIILLDLKMKGKSGFQFAYELRRLLIAHIPIIAMSAFFSKEDFAKLMDVLVIQDFLVKPFNPLDAVKKIKDILRE